MTRTSAEFGARYDEAIFRDPIRALYEGSGFYNVGYWRDGPTTLLDACSALVEHHMAAADAIAQTPPPAVVLDVASGLGATTSMMAARWPTATVVGVNISARQLSHSQARGPQCRWVASDATAMAFADRSADRIISVEAAFHFPSRQSFLREAFRVLRPGGSLVFSDILFGELERIGSWWILGADEITTIRDHLDLCRQAGFRICEASDITQETWHGYMDHLRRRKGWRRIADGIEPAVRTYFMVALQRPPDA